MTDEEIIVRRDGSISVLGTGYYYEETLMDIGTAKDLMWLAVKCDALGRLMARLREED